MAEKTVFINQLSRLLTNRGTIIIEDVSFESQSDLEKYKSEVEDSRALWDYKEEPGYTVWEKHEDLFNNYNVCYEQVSICASIIMLTLKDLTNPL